MLITTILKRNQKVKKNKKVNIVGAGLAGSEAAYQLLKRGYHVVLYEMRPKKMTPAHVSGQFGELVCSNSMRSNSLTNAVGLLKEEMRHLDSLIMDAADNNALPAGSALAVDREHFSQHIMKSLQQFDNLEIRYDEVDTVFSEPTIYATGPLTSDDLAKAYSSLNGLDKLHFFDAVAPIIDASSIDMSIAYRKSRYDKGEGDDYINCPMNKSEFDSFYRELITAKTAELRDFEDKKVFEGCMPVEVMASRGPKTLLFGPMKPVGLETPDGKKPYAVVQLRQDNTAGSLYNIVGFQTHLTWPEQKRLIQMIPGLKDANIVRYGVMHRNTYLTSPNFLNKHYQSIEHPHLFFAGQLSGVEGYVESAASGLYAALNIDRYLNNEELTDFGQETMMGAMAHYVANANPQNFQPMNANYGLLANSHLSKEERATLSLEIIDSYEN